MSQKNTAIAITNLSPSSFKGVKIRRVMTVDERNRPLYDMPYGTLNGNVPNHPLPTHPPERYAPLSSSEYVLEWPQGHSLHDNEMPPPLPERPRLVCLREDNLEAYINRNNPDYVKRSWKSRTECLYTECRSCLSRLFSKASFLEFVYLLKSKITGNY